MRSAFPLRLRLIISSKEEIWHLTKDFYPSFLELIKSIEDGTFKGVKRFTNNHDLLGVNEVKAHQVRVGFVRLAVDTYALITAFVKKSDILYIEENSLL